MDNRVIFGPWTGGVTSNSAEVVLAVENETVVDLLFSDRVDAGGGLANPRTVTKRAELSTGPFAIVTFSLTGLKPGTTYHFVAALGAERVRPGRFTTFPTEGEPASFMFVCAGDAKTGSNHKVFEALAAEEADLGGGERQRPLFFCHLGDLHYEDIKDNDGIKYVNAYSLVLNAPRQAALYRELPIVYTWDDHDYSHNNAGSAAKGRTVARQMYAQCVPHYPFVETALDSAIYQAFTVGRVRFLLSDCRSERTKKTLLGAKQKQWLMQELLNGRDKYPLLVWINTIPWIAEKGEKAWDAWAEERAEIARFIDQHEIRNLCMLSADAHMLAIDDGHNNVPPNGGGGFPVFHAAPLDRDSSEKGGPYSHGPELADGGQYGVVSVRDDGKTVRVAWEGKRVGVGVLMSHEFTSPRQPG